MDDRWGGEERKRCEQQRYTWGEKEKEENGTIQLIGILRSTGGSYDAF